MEDIIVIVILAAVLGLAAWYVIRAKKQGKKCIGCPDSGSCGGSCGSCGEGSQGGCSCGCGTKH